jgi:hypothetical protein
MKHNRSSHPHTDNPASAPQPIAAAEMNGNRVDFTPAPDEVARRAYLNYVNEGAQPGRDVQHWLEAEKQLIAERDLTRVHAFHNRT